MTDRERKRGKDRIREKQKQRERVRDIEIKARKQERMEERNYDRKTSYFDVAILQSDPVAYNRSIRPGF